MTYEQPSIARGDPEAVLVVERDTGVERPIRRETQPDEPALGEKRGAKIAPVMSPDTVAQSQPLWLVLVSSAAVSAAIAGLLNLRAKRNDYVNDYYRTVVKRRIDAYEQLERLILQIKTSVVEPHDNRPYHVMFAPADNAEDPHMAVFGVNLKSLWLSNEVFAETRKLDILLFGLKRGNEIEFGKKHYEAIAKIRHELERLMARDMLTLHDVKHFLKSKDTPDPGFSPVMLQH